MEKVKPATGRTTGERQADGERNEGEGNRTAARQYNQATERFAHSGKVEEKAREAEKARAGSERVALDDAEVIGKRHAAAEDPEVRR